MGEFGWRVDMTSKCFQIVKEKSPAQVKVEEQVPEGEVSTTQQDTKEQVITTSKHNLKGNQLQHW